ncbi:hypothetical protein BC830DRAFT_1123165 [Chytriomyces sp. MP71]|nr:hypothetical protein BC830DRAFT_1123165 [Chytriomyces sp. MP71]
MVSPNNLTAIAQPDFEGTLHLRTHPDLVRDRFICPKDMTRRQALQKAQQARTAQYLIRDQELYPSLNMPHSAIAKLDKAAMDMLRCKKQFKKLPKEWDSLSVAHIRQITEVACYWSSVRDPIYTPEQKDAARLLIDRHEKARRQSERFRELGLEGIASWTDLSPVERSRIEAIATSEWTRVYEGNLFQTEKEARLDAKRKQRQWEEKRGIGAKFSRLEESVRTKRRSELSRLLACV